MHRLSLGCSAAGANRIRLVWPIDMRTNEIKFIAILNELGTQQRGCSKAASAREKRAEGWPQGHMT